MDYQHYYEKEKINAIQLDFLNLKVQKMRPMNDI